MKKMSLKENLGLDLHYAERDCPSFGLSETHIHWGDALEALDRVPDATVQLCVTSPPYNIGKPYEKDSDRNLEEYVNWIKAVLQKINCKLKPGGSLCLQVGNYVRGNRIVPLDYLFYPFLIEMGLHFRNRIIWRYNFGLHAKRRLSGRYEVILWATKGHEYKFNLDAVRVPQIYPGKRHSARKGQRAGLLSGNPLGKNPSDYWEFDPQNAFFGDPVWEIPNVKSNHPEKTDHPCQFPNELVERCILAFTDAGDIVLDPFSGTGTTPICAMLHQRVGVGIELMEHYVIESRHRLAQAKRGELRLRQSGKPVYKPNSTESVATIPLEWLTR